MVLVMVMVLLLAKQIITLYHAVQKTLTKDQHALVFVSYIFPTDPDIFSCSKLLKCLAC
ncbi:hypothetical protein HORM4_990007 [Vibrio harveyi]|nr:hypothetical protein HORM4_990007 [Vibrio harveyi]